MRDLAERSGVALKTLYSQYTDKETLLRSAVEEAHRATYHEIQAMVFNSGLEKLLHVANIVAKNILENETYAKSLAPIMARGVTSTEFGDVRSQVYRSAVQQIAEDGDLHPRLDVDHITRLLLRQIAAIYYEWARGEIGTEEVGTVLRLQMVISLAGLALVAAFGKDDAYGRGLLFAVGADLEEDLGEDNYFGVVYSDPNTDTNAELATEVADALSNNFDDADVVLLLGTAEVTEVLSSYESILDDNNSDASPTFILSDGGKIDETLALVAADMTLSDRIEGTIASLENGAIFTGFRQRYTGEFGEAPGAFASNAYDAAQLLAYGAYTLLQDGQTIDGAGLSNFMSRTVDGQAVQAGPADLSSGLTTLGAGASIDFEGASGPLTFDLGTGEAPSNVDRYVIDVRAADDIRFMDEGQYQVSADGSGEWVGIEEE